MNKRLCVLQRSTQNFGVFKSCVAWTVQWSIAATYFAILGGSNRVQTCVVVRSFVCRFLFEYSKRNSVIIITTNLYMIDYGKFSIRNKQKCSSMN